jgi:hypothetical protein
MKFKLKSIVISAILLTCINSFGQSDIDATKRASEAARVAAKSAADAAAAARSAISSNALGAASIKEARLEKIRLDSSWPRLSNLTLNLLDTVDAKFAIGRFFILVTPPCGFSQSEILTTWATIAPKFARLSASDVAQLIERTSAYSEYRSELQNRLLLAAQINTFEIIEKMNNQPGSKQIIIPFLNDSLLLLRQDCRQLTAIEKQVISQFATLLNQ